MVADAAREMGISRRALQDRIARGDVKAERMNPRLWLVPRAEVERWKGRGKMKPWDSRKARDRATDA